MDSRASQISRTMRSRVAPFLFAALLEEETESARWVRVTTKALTQRAAIGLAKQLADGFEARGSKLPSPRNPRHSARELRADSGGG